MTRLLAIAAALCLAACSQSGDDGAWWVDDEASSLSFVTVKNGDVDEEHELSGISGWADTTGQIRFVLDMSSLETFIDIRNERMAEHLFQTADFPEAHVSARYDVTAYDELAVGDSVEQALDFRLSIRDMPLDLSTSVTITRLAEDRIRVESSVPVNVLAAPLQLEDGIETLRGLAGLDSITPSVAVSFVVEMQR